MLLMMEDGIGQIDHPGCEPLPERAAKRTHLRMLPGSCAVFTPLPPSQGTSHIGALHGVFLLACAVAFLALRSIVSEEGRSEASAHFASL